jgi:hypothetical protein
MRRDGVINVRPSARMTRLVQRHECSVGTCDGVVKHLGSDSVLYSRADPSLSCLTRLKVGSDHLPVLDGCGSFTSPRAFPCAGPGISLSADTCR